MIDGPEQENDKNDTEQEERRKILFMGQILDVDDYADYREGI